MTAVLYSLSAALIASLTTRAWLLDRDDRARRALLGLGWSLAAAYLAFALSLLPGADVLRAVWTTGGCLAAAFLAVTIDATFPRPDGRRHLSWLLGLAVIVGPTAAVAHLLGGYPGGPASPPELVAGVFGYGAGLLSVLRLLRARADAVVPAVQVRIELLAVAILLAQAFGLTEWALRMWAAPVDEAALSFFDRGLELQGALPPVSTLIGAWIVYVLYHAQLAGRVAGLQEQLGRLVVIAAGAVALVLFHLVSLRWIALTRFPLHGSFVLLLVTIVFLSTWEGVRAVLQRRITRVLHTAGQDLDEALATLRRRLPLLLTRDDVLRVLVEGLYSSGRFAWAGIWLYEDAVSAYRLAITRGEGHPLTLVAPAPFASGFDRGEPWYDARVLPRTLTLDARQERAAMLGALEVDLVVPLRHGGAVLGWLAVRDGPSSDGLSDTEVQRLVRVADAAALGLGNISNFQRMAEARRLVALGAMSAGLAHEIRNPLAGLKGAAQVLQSDPQGVDAADMLQIVVDETDRLDRVVRDFLEIARPLVPQRDAEDLGRLVRHAAAVARAAGLAAGVELRERVPDDLPRLPFDDARIGQVLHNLLRNALEAVGQRGLVILEARAREDVVEVTVQDDGPGIAPEIREDLFTPFVTTRTTGTGLGLAIARRIVEAHGGTLQAASPPGGGALFTVRLPRPA